MILLLTFLFLVATAIGLKVAMSVAAAIRP
jgi:hypothetical protein